MSSRTATPVSVDIVPRRAAAVGVAVVAALLAFVIMRVAWAADSMVALLIGAAMSALFVMESIRLFGTVLTIDIGSDTFTIRRGEKTIFSGPYFAVRRTVMPLFGVAFFIEPMPALHATTMNFANVFVMNARRDRIALPGIFLADLDRLWEAVPEDKRTA